MVLSNRMLCLTENLDKYKNETTIYSNIQNNNLKYSQFHSQFTKYLLYHLNNVLTQANSNALSCYIGKVSILNLASLNTPMQLELAVC